MLHALRLGILLLVFGSLFSLSYAASTCNDIDISPLSVTFAEDRDNRLITFDIENNGNEDFELDDVRVQESSPFLDISVDDFPDQINEDESEDLRLRYDTVDVNGDRQETFRIQLRGEFEDNEDCEFADLTFTVHVTIQDGDDVCSLIQIEADDVTLNENDTILHTVRVTNHSSNDFTLQGFDVFDDGDSFTANAEPPFSDADFEKNLQNNRTNSYTIEIDARGVSEDETNPVFVEIRGEFENGYDCSFSDISETFDVTVEDTGVQTGVCTELNVNIPFVSVRAGETNTHTFTLSNNADQHFYVDEYTFADKNYQVAFEPVSNPVKVESQSTEEIAFDAIGYSNAGTFDANAFLTIKGHFTDGGSCLVNAKRFEYRFIGTENASCDSFYAGLKPITVLRGEKSIDVLFNNPLAYDATLYISSTSGTISPAKLIIPANTVKLQTFFVSNTAVEQIITIKTNLQGCTVPDQLSTVLFSGLEDAPVQLVNAPALLNIYGAREFALQLENKSTFTQEVTLNVLAKPGTQTFSKTIQLGGLDTPLVYIPAQLFVGKSIAIVQVTSAGYTNTHTIQLENTPPSSPGSAAPSDEVPIVAAANAITGFVVRGGGFWLGILVLLALIAIWRVSHNTPNEGPENYIINGSEKSPIDEMDEIWLPKSQKSPKIR